MNKPIGVPSGYEAVNSLYPPTSIAYRKIMIAMCVDRSFPNIQQIALDYPEDFDWYEINSEVV